MVIISQRPLLIVSSFNFFLINLFSVIYRGAHIAANMIASNKEIATKVGRAYSSNLQSDWLTHLTIDRPTEQPSDQSERLADWTTDRWTTDDLNEWLLTV